MKLISLPFITVMILMMFFATGCSSNSSKSSSAETLSVPTEFSIAIPASLKASESESKSINTVQAGNVAYSIAADGTADYSDANGYSKVSEAFSEIERNSTDIQLYLLMFGQVWDTMISEHAAEGHGKGDTTTFSAGTLSVTITQKMFDTFKAHFSDVTEEELAEYESMIGEKYTLGEVSFTEYADDDIFKYQVMMKDSEECAIYLYKWSKDLTKVYSYSTFRMLNDEDEDGTDESLTVYSNSFISNLPTDGTAKKMTNKYTMVTYALAEDGTLDESVDPEALMDTVNVVQDLENKDSDGVYLQFTMKFNDSYDMDTGSETQTVVMNPTIVSKGRADNDGGYLETVYSDTSVNQTTSEKYYTDVRELEFFDATGEYEGYAINDYTNLDGPVPGDDDYYLFATGLSITDLAAAEASEYYMEDYSAIAFGITTYNVLLQGSGLTDNLDTSKNYVIMPNGTTSGSAGSVIGTIYADASGQWSAEYWGSEDQLIENPEIWELGISDEYWSVCTGKYTKVENVDLAPVDIDTTKEWTLIGSSSDITAKVNYGDFKVDSQGNLYYAYTNRDNFAVQVMKYDGSSWSQVGSDITGGAWQCDDLEIDGDDNIYVAYTSTTSFNIAKFDGSSWNVIGTSANDGLPAFINQYTSYLEMALDPSDSYKPVIVFRDHLWADKTCKISVYKYAGDFTTNSWTAVGDNSLNSKYLKTPLSDGNIINYYDVTVDNNGEVILAYHDAGEDGTGGSSNLRVIKSSDTSTTATWSTMGAESLGICNGMQIKMGSDGLTPYIAFSGYGYKINMIKWSGSAWEQIGSPIGEDLPVDLKFGLDSNDTPYVAYLDRKNNYQGTVRSWNDTDSAWELVGGVNEIIGTPSIYLAFGVGNSGKLYVSAISRTSALAPTIKAYK
jgi:hypothetical protein